MKTLIIEHQFTNTISQSLISLKDFAPSITEYYLSLSVISDRKKGDQKGYQKKDLLDSTRLLS
jgi:hypothetical protein